MDLEQQEVLSDVQCRRVAAVIAALLLFSAATVCLAMEGNEPAMERGSVHQGQTPSHNVDVWWYLPVSAKSNAVPCVVSYHGASERGSQEIARWEREAGRLGFALVCPTSKCAGAYVKPATPLQLQRADYVLELEAVVSFVQPLIDSGRIDPDRVLVSGFSGGGNPAYHHAFARPDFFHYLAARSGNFPGEWLLGDARLPAVARASKRSEIYVCWGTHDHPIILREAPAAVAWLERVHAKHVTTEIIPNGRHVPSVAETVRWLSRRWYSEP